MSVIDAIGGTETRDLKKALRDLREHGRGTKNRKLRYTVGYMKKMFSESGFWHNINFWIVQDWNIFIEII